VLHLLACRLNLLDAERGGRALEEVAELGELEELFVRPGGGAEDGGGGRKQETYNSLSMSSKVVLAWAK
jgi:hypothetical protein